MTYSKMIEVGVCECHFEPRGDNGLEGYMRNNVYPYEKMKDDKGIYYRVYPERAGPPDWGDDAYYETCGPTVFKRYFKETPNESMGNY